MKDYLIVVESKNTFDGPRETHRLIEVSSEFVRGFVMAIKLCYPKNAVMIEDI